MNTLQQMLEYTAAIEQEKAAWQAVKGRLPGTPSYCSELWLRWRDAVAKTDIEAKRMCRETLPHLVEGQPSIRPTAGVGKQSTEAALNWPGLTLSRLSRLRRSSMGGAHHSNSMITSQQETP